MKNKFFIFILLFAIILSTITVSAESTLVLSIFLPDTINKGDTIDVKLIIDEMPSDVVPMAILAKLRYNEDTMEPVKGVGSQVSFIVTSDNLWDLSITRELEDSKGKYIECVFFAVGVPDTAVGMAFIMQANIKNTFTSVASLGLEITALKYMDVEMDEVIVYDKEGEYSKPPVESQEESSNQPETSEETQSDTSWSDTSSQNTSDQTSEHESSQEQPPADNMRKYIGLGIIVLTVVVAIVLATLTRTKKKTRR